LCTTKVVVLIPNVLLMQIGMIYAESLLPAKTNKLVFRHQTIYSSVVPEWCK
jgi:hypothetical protein